MANKYCVYYQQGRGLFSDELNYKLSSDSLLWLHDSVDVDIVSPARPTSASMGQKDALRRSEGSG